MTMLPLIRTELSALRPLRSFAEAMPDDHLTDDLRLDELDRISLALNLEEALGIDLPDHVIARWHTVADVLASVEKERV